MRGAFSKDGSTVDAFLKISTPKNFEDGITALSRMASEVREAAGGGEIVACAGGIAGPLDPGKYMAIGGPNIPSWHDKPLKYALEEVLRVPVLLENDAVMGALGEANFGAGKGKNIVAYLTVGTGMGGARTVGGNVDATAFGYEPGWQIINTHGAEKYLWQLISGASVTRKTGMLPREITDEKFWDEQAKILAYGVHNIALLWSPDIILLGGSMMKEVGIPIEKVRLYAKNAMKIFPSMPPIEHATLGDESGIYGALALLNRRRGA